MSLSVNIRTDRTFGEIPFRVEFSIDVESDTGEVVDTSGMLCNWFFGNGKSSTDLNPVVTYNTCGDHTVFLEVLIRDHPTIRVEARDLIKGVKADFDYNLVPYTNKIDASFINKTTLPTGYSLNSLSWDFGDDSPIGTDESPTHTYRKRGSFSTRLEVSVTQPDGTTATLSTVKRHIVNFNPVMYNKSNKFLCIGWVRKPLFSGTDPLYPLVITDPTHDINSTDTIKFGINPTDNGLDQKLTYMNSESSGIKDKLGIDIEDGEWHSLVYTCKDKNGTMEYYVDGLKLPEADGYSDAGYPLNIAYSETNRAGGGNIWAPYLYNPGQGVEMFNWRFKSGIHIDEQWLLKLLDRDKKELGVDINE